MVKDGQTTNIIMSSHDYDEDQGDQEGRTFSAICSLCICVFVYFNMSLCICVFVFF